jgi:hypothetical protein
VLLVREWSIADRREALRECPADVAAAERSSRTLRVKPSELLARMTVGEAGFSGVVGRENPRKRPMPDERLRACEGRPEARSAI